MRFNNPLAIGLIAALPVASNFNGQASGQEPGNNEPETSQRVLAAFSPDFGGVTINGQPVNVDVELLDAKTGAVTAGFIASLNTKDKEQWRTRPPEILRSTDPLVIHGFLTALREQHVEDSIPANMPSAKARQDMMIEISERVLAEAGKIYGLTYKQWAQRYPDQHAQAEQERANNTQRPSVAPTAQDFEIVVHGEEVRVFVNLHRGGLTYGAVASLDPHHGDTWTEKPESMLLSTDPFLIHRAITHAQGHDDLSIFETPDRDSFEGVHGRALEKLAILDASQEMKDQPTNGR